MARVFTNGPGDRGSVPGRVIPKTKKMVLDAFLFITQHYKVLIEDKWRNPGKEVVAIEKGAFGSSSTMVGQLYLYLCIYIKLKFSIVFKRVR